MKKIICIMTAALMTVSLLGGCGSSSGSTTASTDTATDAPAPPQAAAAAADSAAAEAEAVSLGYITVVTREEGSGTRGAFVELMGIEDADGNDATTMEAEISNSTSVVMSTVAGNAAAIGYVSLGSLSNTVKSVSVDGVEATVDNIKAGSYAVSRPFEICYKEENLTDLGRDFISYIMSAEGQAIIAEEGYIAVDESAENYTGSGMSGTLSLNGSTSVSPVMEVLAEAYREINPNVTIDIQQTGSGSGITATIDGSTEIGMSSRELKDTELAEGLTEMQIALDGIAVIVNNENPVENLTSEQICQIFLGEVTDWSEIG
ncbi:MAG: substrate-binding domain-containing protein [Oscillospiraceae bacterium]|nr:substrate-binding domain-containing protein [Oscillospiraceae bacterium]